MTKSILTVTLNPAVDKIYQTAKLTPGQDHWFPPAQASAGGKGINVSRGLKRLGLAARATGFLGGPSGEYIHRALNQENIAHRFIPIRGETRVSLTIIQTSTGQSTRILEEGPGVSWKEIGAFRRAFAGLLKNSSHVVFSGRNIPGAGQDFYASLIRTARQAGKKTILDTSGPALAAGLKAGPSLIKPNRAEAEAVLRYKLDTAANLKRGLQYFRRLGIETVIISLGPEGVVAVHAKESWRIIPPRIQAVNLVGCGDALIAGFLYAESRKLGFVECLRMAVAAGTANALTMTPGDLSRGEVMKMFRGVKASPI